MLDGYATFSTHARDRIKECQISVAKAYWLLYQAEKEKLPKDLREYKRSKYAQQALHLRYGTYIFTLIPMKGEEKRYLVLSVFDQRITLK